MQKLAISAGVLISAVSSVALATPISGAGSLAGANPINLPATNTTGSGPIAIGGGVAWNSNQPNSLYGWTNGYTTSNATILPGDPPIIALNAAYNVADNGYAKMWLSFATPTSGFLAELFWTDGEYTAANSAGMYAYDSSMQLLGGGTEYWALNNNGNSDGHSAGYYGFSRPTADISYIYFDNSHIGARNLSYIGPAINVPSGVPEPATWALMLLGFVGIGVTNRKRPVGRTAVG